MTRTCFVHIGMHKTGTTTIQNVFSRLVDPNLNYLELSDTNLGWAMATMFSGTADTHALNRGSTRAEIEERRGKLFSRTLEQIEGNTKSLIISGEYMSLHFSAADVRALRAYLEPHFERLRVIVYIREPYSYMRSVSQQYIKNGPLRLDVQAGFPAYKTQLSPWTDAFNPEEMEFVLFDPAAFPGGDVARDFGARIGAASIPSDIIRDNESLSAEGYAVRYLLRTILERKGASLGQRLRAAHYMVKVNDYGVRRFDLDYETCRSVVEARRDEIEWVEDRLGRVLPQPKLQSDCVTFRNEEEVLSFARSEMPAFEASVPLKWMDKRKFRNIKRLLRGRPTV
jgi:hypothetical protein